MSPGILDKITSVFKTPVAGGTSRPPFEGVYPYLLSALIGFMAADLLIIAYRDKMLPTTPPPARRPILKMAEHHEKFDYDRIVQRNIFNSDGVIPPPVGRKDNVAPEEQLNTPVLSQLPLNLIGTIVHVNPARSIATIEFKSGGKVLPFVPNDEMEGMGTVVKVERKRCIFRNSNNNRLEYIEIKDDSTLSFSTTKKAGTPDAGAKDNNFALKREEVNSLLNNLPEVLQQARAVPNILPGTNGKVDGFRILDIAPGSIFEKLGLQRQDIIKEVNGQMVDSPAKALEMYNDLKSSGQIMLSIDRNGKKENFNYTIN